MLAALRIGRISALFVANQCNDAALLCGAQRGHCCAAELANDPTPF